MPPPGAPGVGPSDAVMQLENTTKRDFLQSLDKKYQDYWKEQRFFDVDAPTNDDGLRDMTPDEVRKKYPKWFGTIPYPYMNGSLHLGHAFSMSKIEFAAGYERLKGKRALFPWAFHCTGMPIRSSADKLIREIELFGKDFAGYKEESDADSAFPPTTATATSSATKTNVDKATKGKVAAKATGLKYQFQILESIGVPRDEIHKFADAHYWLEYFPPIAKADSTSLGARIDWRRAFLTTDVNPYYDSFVRWQVNKLHAMNKIKFGERYTIFSPKDGQPCMDHDRSEGEALGPQEYTALKMEVVQWSGDAATELDAIVAGKKVFFVAATLRPETMYGQTNCYVGPKIPYGLFAINDTDVYLCTERAARNMAFQGITAERGKVQRLATIEGSKLIGTSIKAPNGHYPEVYVLPMDSVLPTKGTGVVTSVPSDSPDDYAMLMELRKKAEYYKVDPKWVALDPYPVIRTPSYGDLTAETLCKQFKIQSPKDKAPLAEAKELAYKEGFYQGTMLAGPYKGEPVQEAKDKVRKDMIAADLAFAYAEPEGRIVSRSSDECVVALCDQWYMDYGEESWKAAAIKLTRQANTYQSETLNAFESVLGWLHQWACARSYGLGSKLPWDTQFLVESLSDSTIYMAYYTIAHHLQGGVENGSKVGPIGIKADELTDEVWDYILGDSELPSTSIPKEKLDILQREFQYFYPFDIRSSGKDLIPNHLTFCIYVHSAIFPQHHWPRSIRVNGHLMLNGKKMAKSTGNSLTLRQSVDKFGADATRLSLADAGDGIEDANFEEKSANANILRLFTLIEWIDETIKTQDKLRTGPKDSFWDKAFENDINTYITKTDELCAKTHYKDALKYGFYEMQTSRDLYRDATGDIGMHRDLIVLWIRTQALLVAPFAPHFAEHVWRTLLEEKDSIQTTRFPEVSSPVNASVTEAASYIRALTKTIRDAEIALTTKKPKGKAVVAPSKYDERKPKALRIFVAKSFPEWQDTCVSLIKEHFDEKTGTVDDVAIRKAITANGMIKDKKVMPYIMAFKKRVTEFGPVVAFDRVLPFNETETLQGASGYLKRTMRFDTVVVESAEDVLARSSQEDLQGRDGFDARLVEAAEPGVREYHLEGRPIRRRELTVPANS